MAEVIEMNNFSWRNEPDLMARLRTAQNQMPHVECRDILTFAGLCSSVEELTRHVESCERQIAEWVPPAPRRRQRKAA